MLAPMACIADAHADSLMWNRDLTRLQTGGHVDFPRLAQAKVGLQCFTLVTRGLPVIGGFPVFAAARGWPRKARTHRHQRHLHHLELPAPQKVVPTRSQHARLVARLSVQSDEPPRRKRLAELLDDQARLVLGGMSRVPRKSTHSTSAARPPNTW